MHIYHHTKDFVRLHYNLNVKTEIIKNKLYNTTLAQISELLSSNPLIFLNTNLYNAKK